MVTTLQAQLEALASAPTHDARLAEVMFPQPPRDPVRETLRDIERQFRETWAILRAMPPRFGL